MAEVTAATEHQIVQGTVAERTGEIVVVAAKRQL
jgi:hypothetical protein